MDTSLDWMIDTTTAPDTRPLSIVVTRSKGDILRTDSLDEALSYIRDCIFHIDIEEAYPALHALMGKWAGEVTQEMLESNIQMMFFTAGICSAPLSEQQFEAIGFDNLGSIKIYRGGECVAQSML